MLSSIKHDITLSVTGNGNSAEYKWHRELNSAKNRPCGKSRLPNAPSRVAVVYITSFLCRYLYSQWLQIACWCLYLTSVFPFDLSKRAVLELNRYIFTRFLFSEMSHFLVSRMLPWYLSYYSNVIFIILLLFGYQSFSCKCISISFLFYCSS